MEIKRKNVRVGPTLVRHSITIESNECELGTYEGWYEQKEILNLFLNSPEATNCGPSKWHEMSIFHNGSKWIAEAKATVEELVK